MRLALAATLGGRNRSEPVFMHAGMARPTVARLPAAVPKSAAATQTPWSQPDLLHRIQVDSMGFVVQPGMGLDCVRALRHLVAVEGGATPEQLKLLQTLALHLLGVSEDAFSQVSTLLPQELAARLPETRDRRRFLQLAIMLDLCRHPRSEEQLQRLEAFAAALDFQGAELQMIEALCHRSAEEATADFMRIYATSMPELSEHHGATLSATGELIYDDDFFDAVAALASQPRGSLGRCFAEFYERNGLTLPSRATPNPGYYVCHDMNHVITGYEATGPGEIALGAFKLALHDSEANWLASLTNFLIHEVGLFKHGTDLQFVPYGGGGEPYHGIDGKRGALDLPGAVELLVEAFQRGSKCTGDFSALDHLAMAHVPLLEIRREFNVVPMAVPMFDDAESWPA